MRKLKTRLKKLLMSFFYKWKLQGLNVRELILEPVFTCNFLKKGKEMKPKILLPLSDDISNLEQLVLYV